MVIFIKKTMNKFLLLLIFPLLVSAQQKTEAFKKIIFHTSMCFGKCPVYHLQVESNKKVKLYAEHVYKQDANMKVVEDSSKIGYFTGTVDNQLFNSLVKELKKIKLDSVKLDGPTCCDGSVTSLIIYYRAKRRSGRSMVPAEEMRPVISILSQICRSEDLKRTTEHFVIEKEKDASTLLPVEQKPAKPKAKPKPKSKAK
jgi:hypothetical protein